jgi:hypothetical protein
MCEGRQRLRRMQLSPGDAADEATDTGVAEDGDAEATAEVTAETPSFFLLPPQPARAPHKASAQVAATMR